MNQRWRSKLLALILVVVMTLGMLPAGAQAAGETGTTGIWKWKVLDDGTLSITGCTAPSGDLTLPASFDTGSGPVAVTRIEDTAFKSSNPIFFPSEIKTFAMPDSVTSVGDSAFSWCNKLTSVTLSSNLRNIGASAFYNCSALTSITLPDSVESIGAAALANCSKLGEVTLPDNVSFTALPEKLFDGDSLLKTTNISSLTHLTSIGSHAFLSAGVENITLPDSVIDIGDGAFEACWYLVTINLPDNAGFTALPDNIFAECKALESLTIPASVTSIGADALNGCNVLREITVEGANAAFSSEEGVLYNADKTILICHPAGRPGALDIPDSVTEIGDYAFLNSSHLTAVSIPDSVERIGEGAFFNCSNPSLSRIVLPDSVQSIGEYAFNACAGLTQMDIPEGIEGIGPYTFNFCGNLTGIALPDSLQSIGNFAFLGCDSLNEVTIPQNVTGIGSGAFQFCTGLRKAVIPGAGTSCGSDVFKYTAISSDGIYGFESSAAQAYAQTNGIPFHTLYTVSFSVGEGSPVSDILAAAGGKIIKPADPTRPSFVFGGWYKDAVYSDDWDFDSDTVNEDTILYAKWTAGTAPTITTTSLPGGTVGMTYSQTLAAAGDTPITWSIVNGNLPDGLTLTSGDTVSGIPTAGGTFNFTIGAENTTGSDTQDLSIVISKTLLSIATPTAITGVANGTLKTASALGLPSTVSLVTNEGDVSGDVTWDVAPSSYDPSDTDAQTFTVNGTVILPSGVVNPDGVSLDVTISVTVLAAAVSMDKTLISVTTPTAITGVANGTEKTATALGLPSKVTLVTDGGNVSGDVAWNLASSTYDPSHINAQTFTVNGTVILPSGVVNPDGVSLDVTISVTVLAAAVSTDETLISVTTPTAITGVANGTAKTESALGLPSTVTLVTNDGNVSGNVVWNVASSAYDPSDTDAQTFTVNGTVSLPSGVVNPDGVSLDVTINVSVKSRSGGSSSGGGSSGGGSSSPPATPSYTADMEVTDVSGNGMKKTTLPVTVDKNAGSAAIDIGNLLSDGETSVITLPSMPDINTFSLGIPVPSLSSSDGKGSLTLHTDMGSFTVPSNMLTGVESVDGSKAQITIGQGDQSALPETVRTAIGNRPLIRLTLSVDGQQTAWNNPDAPVTVSIPYTPTAEELANPEHIMVWYIDGAGNVASVPNGHYAPDTGTVVFSTSHFSDYAVAYDPVIRLAGVDGIETALAIARAAYPGKIAAAVLSTVGNYPDALAGSVLAGKLNAPILLVGDSEAAQKKILDYLTAKLEADGTVYILGGTAVIGQSFEDKLRDVGIKHTIRLAGMDGYSTSVKIAEQLQVETGTPVVLVSGENYPDALSVSSIAAQKGYPILLVQKDGIPAAVKQKIAAFKPDKVYIIGLQGAVSENVENEVRLLTGLAAEDLIRIGGEDRYDTSLAVAQYFLPSLSAYSSPGVGSPSRDQAVCIATGNNYPDALAGSVYAAKHKVPIILVDDSLSEQVIHYLEAGELSKAAIFGGESVVGTDIEEQLRKLAGQ